MRTSGGIPFEFRILPGSRADLQGLAESALDLPGRAQLILDSAYDFYEWEKYLSAEENLRLLVPRKTNSERSREPWLELRKFLMRKYIDA